MKIAVAMSGGVDSSAAAALLKEQGHELVGFTMQLWNQRRGISVDENGDPLPSRCCSLDDVYDARRVAEGLGFPFYVLNLEREFEAVGRRAICPKLFRWRNADPVRCLQLASEICLARQNGGVARLRQSCDRPLCSRRIRRSGRSISTFSRAKSLERSELFSLGTDAGSAFAVVFSARRDAEGRGPRHRPRRKSIHRRKEGVAGDLLCARRQVFGIY